MLDNVTRWEKFFARDARAEFATARTVLIAGARFAAEILAPTNAVGDTQGARLITGRVHLPKEIREAFAQDVADLLPPSPSRRTLLAKRRSALYRIRSGAQ